MLTDDVDRYIELRRSLGFKLAKTARHLAAFARYAVGRGDTHVRRETAIAWTAAVSSTPRSHQRRLGEIALFARFLHAEDRAHEVPHHHPNHRALLDTCHAKGIAAALERSRSGNGGHVWIFFSEPVPARVARQLGAALITETMEKRPEIGFTSYDRFFPNQDTMPLTENARALSARLETAVTQEEKVDARTQISRLRKRLANVTAIDFFGASSRLTAEGMIAELEASVAEDKGMADELQQSASQRAAELKGRTWVTRKGVHVDRIACSWLIRRFIDPDAIIRFAPGKGYVPKPGELRFDMFEGEFTHEGDRCSFEVLLARTGLSDPALQAIAEIVHDIDLKDGKFARDEAAGIARLIAGIAMANSDDEQRIAQGAPVFDNLYEYFRKKRG